MLGVGVARVEEGEVRMIHWVWVDEATATTNFLRVTTEANCCPWACNHRACARRLERMAVKAAAAFADAFDRAGEDEDNAEKRATLHAHKVECQQAFARPPKRSGRGREPVAWSTRRPPRRRNPRRKGRPPRPRLDARRSSG